MTAPTTQALEPELLPHDECIVHIYPSDLARMARNETTATVFSVAVGCPDEKSVPLYTAEQVLAAIAADRNKREVSAGLSESAIMELAANCYDEMGHVNGTDDIAVIASFIREAESRLRLPEGYVAVPELSDDEIVKVLHSLAIDTYPSKYGFPELQVSATNVPMIRKIVKAYIAAAPSEVQAKPREGDKQ